MICKNLKTNLYYNYRFYEDMTVELNDNVNPSFFVTYHDWCIDYLVIDKWRNLNELDLKYNENIRNKNK